MLTILTRNLDVIPNEVATCTTDATFTCILILIWLGINVCKEFTDKKMHLQSQSFYIQYIWLFRIYMYQVHRVVLILLFKVIQRSHGRRFIQHKLQLFIYAISVYKTLPGCCVFNNANTIVRVETKQLFFKGMEACKTFLCSILIILLCIVCIC